MLTQIDKTSWTVEHLGTTYTINRLASDDCIVLCGGVPVDDTVAANVYMLAFLELATPKRKARTGS